MVLALAASLLVAANILNQGLRGVGCPHAGLVSQLLGIGVMAIAALYLIEKPAQRQLRKWMHATG